MLLNTKLNDTAQKIIRTETVHMRKRMRNSMATTGSTKILFEIIHGEKQDHLLVLRFFIDYVCHKERKYYETDEVQYIKGHHVWI